MYGFLVTLLFINTLGLITPFYFSQEKALDYLE